MGHGGNAPGYARIVIKKLLATAQKQAATMTRTVFRGTQAPQGQAATLSMIVRSPNTAVARERQLQEAIAEIERAVTTRTIRTANDATKRALEGIHELGDCERRGEWSQAGWGPDDVGLWRAHIGARNASHHTSSTVVALHADADTPTQHLRWDLDSAAIASLDSAVQQREFNARLAGQDVLPPLKALASKISAAVR